MTKKRLNVKPLILLLVVAAVVGVGGKFLHDFQVRRAATGYLESARNYLKQEKLTEAEKYLATYLGFRPDDDEALVEYAELRDKLTRGSTREKSQVLAIYGRALARGGSGKRDAFRRRAAELAIEVGDTSIAREHLRVLEEKAPKDGGIAYLMGRADEIDGLTAQAAEKYAESIEKDPTRIETYVHLANLRRGVLNDPVGADNIMSAGKDTSKGLVGANPQSPAAYLARAAYLTATRRPGQGEVDVLAALSIAPNDKDVLLAAADVAARRGQLDDAREHLRRVVELFPKDIRAYQNLARVEIAAGKTDEALDWLEQGIKIQPDDYGLRITKAEALIAARRFNDVDPVLRDLDGLDFPTSLINMLKGTVLASKGQWKEATTLLEQVRSLVATEQRLTPEIRRGTLHRVLTILGNCYTKLGNADRRLECFRDALALEPGDPATRLEYANALVTLERTDDAKEEFERLVPIMPVARVPAARLLLLKTLNQSPERRDWDPVNKALDGLAKLDKKVVDELLLRAEVRAAQDDMAGAKTLLLKARDEFPDALGPWLSLSVVEARAGDYEAAKNLLDQAEKKLGDSVGLRLARSQLVALGDAKRAAAEIAALGDATDKFDAEDRRTLFRGLAAACLRVGDREGAERFWDRIGRDFPSDISVRVARFDLAQQQGDLDAMDRLAAEIREIDGAQGVQGRFSQALALVARMRKEGSKADDARQTEARALLLGIAAARPTLPRVPLLLAQLDEMVKRIESASDNYAKAIDLGERDPLVVRRALELLYTRQRFADAERLLRKVRQQVPLVGEFGRVAAMTSLKTQDLRRALELARQSIPENSKEPRDYLWLAQMEIGVARQETKPAEATRLLGEAEANFRKATDLGPELPETWLGLVQFLAQSGRADMAATEFARAEKVLKGPQAALALALCEETMGRRDAALKRLLAAEKAKPGDPEIQIALAGFYLRGNQSKDAEAYFRKLVANPNRSTEMTDRANRALAVLRASQGGQAALNEALEMLSQPVASAGTAARSTVDKEAADDRAKSRLLALQPNRDSRKRAIAIIESLEQREQATADDRFILAQLHEADDDWPKARDSMLVLLQNDAKNPVILARYLDALVRKQRFEEAAPILARLKEVDPKGNRTIELEARVLVGQFRREQAVRLLEQAVKEDDSRTFPIAVLMEQLGLNDAAESMYKALIKKTNRPEAELAYARFLGRRGQPEPALAICEKLKGKVAPKEVGTTAVAVLYASSVDDKQCERVAGWLEKTRTDSPGDIEIDFDLANVRILQGRFKDAEAIFLKLENGTTSSAGPMNNLAWMWALQGDKTDKPLRKVNQAIELAGGVPDLLDTRGFIYLTMGQVDNALKDLQDSIAVQPAGLTYYHLAQALYRKEDTSGAADSLKKAVDHGFEPTTLHPIERKQYEKLRADLASR